MTILAGDHVGNGHYNGNSIVKKSKIYSKRGTKNLQIKLHH